MSGFLPIPRDFFSQLFWREERSFSKAEAYLDLLQFAAFAPSERIVLGKVIDLDEGECIASVRFLAERWSWGKDKAAQYMKLLEDRQYIRRDSRQGETVVILLKYKDWSIQSDVSPDRNKDRHTDRDQTPTRTNKKKEEKINKDTPLPPKGGNEGKGKVLPEGCERWSAKRQKSTRVIVNNAKMIRIGGFLNRQPETLWTVEEALVLSRLKPTESEIATVEEYYLAIIPKEEDYRRRNLITLLNNWNGEHDKASLWKNSK